VGGEGRARQRIFKALAYERAALTTLSARLAQAGKNENVWSGERGASSDAVRNTHHVSRDA